jgi:hypothetical protein
MEIKIVGYIIKIIKKNWLNVKKSDWREKSRKSRKYNIYILLIESNRNNLVNKKKEMS